MTVSLIHLWPVRRQTDTADRFGRRTGHRATVRSARAIAIAYPPFKLQAFDHDVRYGVDSMSANEPTDRASILLVDDHSANLLALEASLEPLGQNLVKASSGEEALARVAEREYAAVLLDVRMPGLDGFETAARIREIDGREHTPIIFLTAHAADEKDARRAYARSAVDFLVKPFDHEILASKVKVFVDLYLRGQTIRHQDVALRQAEREALARIL